MANDSYGFRTEQTLSSPEIWYPADRFGAYALLAAGTAVCAVGGWLIRRRRAWPAWSAILAFLAMPMLYVAALAASVIYLGRLHPSN